MVAMQFLCRDDSHDCSDGGDAIPLPRRQSWFEKPSNLSQRRAFVIDMKDHHLPYVFYGAFSVLFTNAAPPLNLISSAQLSPTSEAANNITLPQISVGPP